MRFTTVHFFAELAWTWCYANVGIKNPKYTEPSIWDFRNLKIPGNFFKCQTFKDHVPNQVHLKGSYSVS